MAEGRMAEIVGKRQPLGQVLVGAEVAGERAGDLRHFERMGEARTVVIAFVIDEDLGLVVEPAERRRSAGCGRDRGHKASAWDKAARAEAARGSPRIDGVRGEQPRGSLPPSAARP